MRLSTTSTLNENQDAVLIHVVNRGIYGELASDAQMDDTIAMMESQADKVGALDVVGIRFEPLWDHNRNVMLMMAYGTAIFA